MPATKIPGRLPSLDGLRAVSICLVLLWHMHSQGAVPGTNFFSYYYGTLGVQIFFVISGFLITWLLLDEEDKTGSVSLKSFYVRRGLRIIPVQIAYLAVLALLSRTTEFHWSTCQFLTAITYTKNFGCQTWPDAHLWSLSVEEQFYLLWPPLLVMAGRRSAVVAALTLIVLFPLLRVVFHVMHTPGVGGLVFYDNLMIGCVTAILAHCAPQALARLVSWHPTPLRASAVLGMVAINELQGHYLLGVLTVPFGFTMQALCAAYLVASYVFNRTGIGYMLLNARAVVYAGTLSYSLYVWQQLFFSRPQLFGFETSIALAFPFNLLLILVTAMVSYHLFELPLARLRSNLHPRHGRGVNVPFRQGAPNQIA